MKNEQGPMNDDMRRTDAVNGEFLRGRQLVVNSSNGHVTRHPPVQKPGHFSNCNTSKKKA